MDEPAYRLPEKQNTCSGFWYATYKKSVFSQITESRTNVCILKTGILEHEIIEQMFDKKFFENIEKSC